MNILSTTLQDFIGLPNTPATRSAMIQTISQLAGNITAAQHRISVQHIPNTEFDSGLTLTFIATPKTKYTFTRAKWYEAVYNYNYYHEVEAWCTEQFGAPCREPDAWSRWIHLPYYDEIHFRDEKDYVWFKLRWS